MSGKSKIVSVSETESMISDGDKIAISLAGIAGYLNHIVKHLENRFLETAYPYPEGLTLYVGCGHGVPYLYQGASTLGTGAW